MKRIRKTIIFLVFLMILPLQANAEHPLVTDEAETKGQGKYEIEFSMEYGYNKTEEKGAVSKEKEFEAEIEVAYGINDEMDIVLQIPYRRSSEKEIEEGETTSARTSGIGDTEIALKWRFLEKEHGSLALKPFLILPTGNHNKGLGAGRVGYGLYLIGSAGIGKFELHGNLGYIRNDNKTGERKNIFHVSAAAEYEASEHLGFVANLVAETFRETWSNSPSVSLIGGMIYKISRHYRVDFGIRKGLNKTAEDYAILAGFGFEM